MVKRILRIRGQEKPVYQKRSVPPVVEKPTAPEPLSNVGTATDRLNAFSFADFARVEQAMADAIAEVMASPNSLSQYLTRPRAQRQRRDDAADALAYSYGAASPVSPRVGVTGRRNEAILHSSTFNELRALTPSSQFSVGLDVSGSVETIGGMPVIVNENVPPGTLLIINPDGTFSRIDNIGGPDIVAESLRAASRAMADVGVSASKVGEAVADMGRALREFTYEPTKLTEPYSSAPESRDAKGRKSNHPYVIESLKKPLRRR